MKSNNIFHDASLKLTGLYLLIIMGISLIFSISFYRVTSLEIERGLHRPGPIGQMLRSSREDLLEDFLKEQDETIETGKQRLSNNLILMNVLIFVSGGFFSYYFARRSLQPIEEAHDAQLRFTADASHELRTPIAAMRIETELTLTEPKLTLAQARQQLESNMEELDKLTALSENLLNLSRLESTGLETEKVSLGTIIEKSVISVDQAAKNKSQTIHVKNIPKIELLVNEHYMTEAFVTLLDNAIKYSPEKSTITIDTNASKSYVEIIFQDQGQGITEDDLPHIFDRFYRADQSRTKNTTNGYGIGLSIAKMAVESHKGTIKAKSTLGKGSTFTIQLPLS